MTATIAILGALFLLAGLISYRRIFLAACRNAETALNLLDATIEERDAFHAALMAQRGEDFARDAVIHQRQVR
jgi:hypothetical protein